MDLQRQGCLLISCPISTGLVPCPRIPDPRFNQLRPNVLFWCLCRICRTNNNQHVTCRHISPCQRSNSHKYFVLNCKYFQVFTQLRIIVLQFSLSKLKICVLKSIYHSLCFPPILFCSPMIGRINAAIFPIVKSWGTQRWGFL